jgi:hypothetical protein
MGNGKDAVTPPVFDFSASVKDDHGMRPSGERVHVITAIDRHSRHIAKDPVFGKLVPIFMHLIFVFLIADDAFRGLGHRIPPNLRVIKDKVIKDRQIM